MKSTVNDKCPCLSEVKCHCREIINGSNKAQSPEELMRSRYVAFAIGDVDYLIQTSSSLLQNSLNKPDLISYCQSTQFIGLEIIECVDEFVEFKAKLLDGDFLYVLHERSEFMEENGFWKYHSGQLFDTAPIKIKRNDLCPCGANKKYKKCHA